MLTKLKTSFAFLVVVSVIAWPNLSLASATNGTIDSTNKYAWSENIGWLNFGTTTGNVQVTDTALTGYIWSPTYGWINLAPSTSGVTNNGEGDLSGYAWGENTGWIDFSSVSINTTGYFTGYATGDITGQISLTCSNGSSCASSDFKVQTDWRPLSQRGGNNSLIITTNQAKPLEPINALNQPIDFAVKINNGASETTNRLVSLSFLVGTDTKRMAISNDPTFASASQIPFESPYQWSLLPGAGPKTIYVKFYTQWGVASDPVSATITLKETGLNNQTDTPLSPPSVPSTTDPGSSKPGFANGNLVKEFGQPAVYLIDWQTIKRPIISGEVFLTCGFSWNNIIEVANLDNYTTGFPVTMSECKNSVSSTTPTDTTSQSGVGQYQATTNKPTFTKDLSGNIQDPEVKLVQQFLNQHGFTIATSGPGSPGHETDFLGGLTAQAIGKFQKDRGLTVNNQWNAETRQAANALLASPANTPPVNKLEQPDPAVLGEKIQTNLPSAVFTTPLEMGMINDDVKRLQQLLASQPDVYPEGQITGKFGLLTEAAVKRFQLKYKITTADHPAYGFVGPATRAKLLEVFGK